MLKELAPIVVLLIELTNAACDRTEIDRLETAEETGAP